MRTDTATFRRNAFKALRAQGLSSAKTRRVLPVVLAKLARFQPEHPADTELKVSFDDAAEQTIALVRQGCVRIHVDAWDLRGLQPLVNTVPTARQLELREAMSDLIADIYAAMNDGEDAYVAEHGVADVGFTEAQSAFVKTYPPYVAVLARYAAMKAESLAINPNVEASVVDPERASFWYQWHEEAYDYRPSGFRTLAMIDLEMETMPRHIEAEAA